MTPLRPVLDLIEMAIHAGPADPQPPSDLSRANPFAVKPTHLFARCSQSWTKGSGRRPDSSICVVGMKMEVEK